MQDSEQERTKGAIRRPSSLLLCGTMPGLAMRPQRRGGLGNPRRRRRHIKLLPLQKIFNLRDALSNVTILAIELRGQSSVIAHAIGILATACAIAVVVADELIAT